MPTTIAGFRQIAADIPAALANVARQPDVKRESDRYLSAIADVKSIDDFLARPDVYRYAMRAFGLEDMTYATAFVRRALSDGVDRPDSLANRLADPRFRDLVSTFNFARYGSAAMAFSRTQQGVVDRYLRLTLEQNAGLTNEGVRLALYFQRSASSISSPYSLLADRALLKVTQVALGLPQASATLDLDRQADIISGKLAVADLKDPGKLDKFLIRFAALWDVENSQPPPSPLIDLTGTTPAAGIAVALLGQIQSQRTRSGS